jgi:hypothetical protein
MTDNYNTNVNMVYDDESTNSIKPNKELPNFAGIARNIQNLASHCIGLELKEAWLFRKFFGMSVRVVKIFWELVVCDKLRPRGVAWSIVLGKLSHEGVPQAGPRLLGCRHGCRHR